MSNIAFRGMAGDISTPKIPARATSPAGRVKELVQRFNANASKDSAVAIPAPRRSRSLSVPSIMRRQDAKLAEDKFSALAPSFSKLADPFPKVEKLAKSTHGKSALVVEATPANNAVVRYSCCTVAARVRGVPTSRMRHTWTLRLRGGGEGGCGGGEEVEEKEMCIELLACRLSRKKRIFVDGKVVYETRERILRYVFDHSSKVQITVMSKDGGYCLLCDDAPPTLDLNDDADLGDELLSPLFTPSTLPVNDLAEESFSWTMPGQASGDESPEVAPTDLEDGSLSETMLDTSVVPDQDVGDDLAAIESPTSQLSLEEPEPFVSAVPSRSPAISLGVVVQDAKGAGNRRTTPRRRSAPPGKAVRAKGETFRPCHLNAALGASLVSETQLAPRAPQNLKEATEQKLMHVPSKCVELKCHEEKQVPSISPWEGKLDLAIAEMRSALVPTTSPQQVATSPCEQKDLSYVVPPKSIVVDLEELGSKPQSQPPPREVHVTVEYNVKLEMSPPLQQPVRGKHIFIDLQRSVPRHVPCRMQSLPPGRRVGNSSLQHPGSPLMHRPASPLVFRNRKPEMPCATGLLQGNLPRHPQVPFLDARVMGLSGISGCAVRAPSSPAGLVSSSRGVLASPRSFSRSLQVAPTAIWPAPSWARSCKNNGIC